jgi:pyruvate carboxylase subunit B
MLGKDAIIWFHTHDTAGLGTAAIMAAVEAGVDGVDLSKLPVSGGTCQPDILTVWAAFRNTEYTLDIDYQKILKAERVFEECMDKYLMPPESKETSPIIVLSPMPGGALTANTMMMRDTKTLHLFPKVIDEMSEVVARGGYGTSVTPVSQFYFQQAYMNVVQGKWKKIVDGYGNMVLGYFGKTPRPADPEIIKIASEQLKKEPFEGDPLDKIKPGIEPAKKILIDNNIEVTDENIFIIASCQDKGLEFLKGKSPLSVYYKETTKKEEPKIEKETPSPKTIKSEIQDLVVNVNGVDYQVRVSPSGTVQQITQTKETPKPEKKSAEIPIKPITSTKDENDILKAPMHGIVMKILVKEGQTVSKDQPLLMLEAMKMENEISAHKSGVIQKIHVKEGESIEDGHSLISIS